MQKPWTPPVRWILLVAAVLSLFSTAQAYRLTTLNLRVPYDIDVAPLLLLNTVYWFVPAAFTLPIFYLATAVPARHTRMGRVPCDSRTAQRSSSPCSPRLHDGGALGAVAERRQARDVRVDDVRPAAVPDAARLAADDVLRDHRPELRARLPARVTGPRAIKAATLETRLVEARLKTLQAELHPHFLFNTLHAISTLVHTNPDSADRMISRLSDLLRLTFDGCRRAGRLASGGARVPAEVPRDRTDPLPGSSVGQLRRSIRKRSTPRSHG